MSPAEMLLGPGVGPKPPLGVVGPDGAIGFGGDSDAQQFRYELAQMWDMQTIIAGNLTLTLRVDGGVMQFGPQVLIGVMFHGCNLQAGGADVGTTVRAQLFALTDDPANYAVTDLNGVPGAVKLAPNLNRGSSIIIRNGLVFIPVRRIITEPEFFLAMQVAGGLTVTGAMQAFVYTRAVPKEYVIAE